MSLSLYLEKLIECAVVNFLVTFQIYHSIVSCKDLLNVPESTFAKMATSGSEMEVNKHIIRE